MNILIVSLYYPPLNNIASSRMVSFKKYLSELGHTVYVLTRHYSPETLKESSLLIGSSEGTDIPGDYYTEGKTYYVKYSSDNSKLKKSRKLPPGIRGFYNILNNDVFHYSFVEHGLKAYQEEIQSKKIDLIIASSPIIAALDLANKINALDKTPWIADFRDTIFKPGNSIFFDKLTRYASKKLLQTSSAILFVSEGMQYQFNTYIKSLQSKPQKIIMNGFEHINTAVDNVLLSQVTTFKDQYKITFVYTGSLYPEGNLTCFLDWISSSKHVDDIGLITVGIQDEYKSDIDTNYKHLNTLNLNKTSYDNSIAIQKMADYLLLTVWENNYTGFQGKIFEYLYSDRKILLDKIPPKDLKDFLTPFNTVFYCNSSVNEFEKIMDLNPSQLPNTIEQKEQLTRESQVKRLHAFICSNFKSN